MVASKAIAERHVGSNPTGGTTGGTAAALPRLSQQPLVTDAKLSYACETVGVCLSPPNLHVATIGRGDRTCASATPTCSVSTLATATSCSAHVCRCFVSTPVPITPRSSKKCARPSELSAANRQEPSGGGLRPVSSPSSRTGRIGGVCCRRPDPATSTSARSFSPTGSANWSTRIHGHLSAVSSSPTGVADSIGWFRKAAPTATRGTCSRTSRETSSRSWATRSIGWASSGATTARTASPWHGASPWPESTSTSDRRPSLALGSAGGPYDP